MSRTMRALVKARYEPGLWMQDVPVPQPGPTEVLIRVRKSAICGTDAHIWNWDEWAARTVPVPMVTGHEFSGEIAEVGAAVSVSPLVSGYLAKGTSSVAVAATAVRGGAIYAAIPKAWG